MSGAEIAAAIRRRRFVYATEDRLQEGIAAALAEDGCDVAREARIAGGRIDLLVGRVGVEVKVAGAAGDVARQLRRYLEGGDVDELVLVTSRVRHLRLPEAIAGRPVHVVTLAGAGL